MVSEILGSQSTFAILQLIGEHKNGIGKKMKGIEFDLAFQQMAVVGRHNCSHLVCAGRKP